LNLPQSQVQSADMRSGKTNVELKNCSWGRDPFTIVKPPPPPKKIPPLKVDVVLKGIFWEAGKAYVLIDDYVLAEGEEGGGIKVEKIEGKNVICRKGGRQFTLHWRETS
jgi:type II secretory pathway component PulC